MAKKKQLPNHPFFSIDQQNKVFLNEERLLIEPARAILPWHKPERLPAYYLLIEGQEEPYDAETYDWIFIYKIVYGEQLSGSSRLLHVAQLEHFLNYQYQELTSNRRRQFIEHLAELVRKAEQIIYDSAMEMDSNPVFSDYIDDHLDKKKEGLDSVWNWISKIGYTPNYVGESESEFNHKLQILVLEYMLELKIIVSPKQSGLDDRLYQHLVEILIGKHSENTRKYMSAFKQGGTKDVLTLRNLKLLSNELESLNLNSIHTKAILDLINRDEAKLISKQELAKKS